MTGKQYRNSLINVIMEYQNKDLLIYTREDLYHFSTRALEIIFDNINTETED